MTHTDFAVLGLAEPLLRALGDAGFSVPTPIQAKSIPLLLDDHDLIGIAQTGTGKTAAFALPILEHLMEDRVKLGRGQVRALVLAPTRELAIQIGESFAKLGRHARLSHTVVYGGVGIHPQIGRLARGVDVLIATPGRLLDLMNQGAVRFDEVSHFVLDEADRMLDMGFVRDVMKIVGKLPQERQSLLFSATMPREIVKLAEAILFEPKRVEVTPEVVTVEAIDQSVFFVPTSQKRALLEHLLAEDALSRVVVFTRTKHGANRLAEQLAKSGISSDAIHGNKSQNARQRALADFKAGTVRVLVATDLFGRGIDVAEITHVINFDLPNEPESYVHRIGRTGRAGKRGIALSFCDGSERAYLKDIERLTRVSLGVLPLPEGLAAAAKALPNVPPGAPKQFERPAGNGPRGKRNRNRPPFRRAA